MIDHKPRSMIRDGVSLFESQRRADRDIKRQNCKECQADNVETDYMCDICGRHCQSRIGFFQPLSQSQLEGQRKKCAANGYIPFFTLYTAKHMHEYYAH